MPSMWLRWSTQIFLAAQVTQRPQWACLRFCSSNASSPGAGMDHPMRATPQAPDPAPALAGACSLRCPLIGVCICRAVAGVA